MALPPSEGTTSHQLRHLQIFNCQKLPAVGLSLPTPTVSAFPKALKGLTGYPNLLERRLRGLNLVQDEEHDTRRTSVSTPNH